MYCRNCGNEMSNEVVVCVKCGVPAGKGNAYCPACGEPTSPDAVFCVKCGAGFAQNTQAGGRVGDKSKIVAGLLGIFLGAYGIHNFYLGFTKKAVIQIVVSLVTCGIGGIWGLIEGILILCGKNNVDAQGNLLKD